MNSNIRRGDLDDALTWLETTLKTPPPLTDGERSRLRDFLERMRSRYGHSRVNGPSSQLGDMLEACDAMAPLVSHLPPGEEWHVLSAFVRRRGDGFLFTMPQLIKTP